MQRFDIRREDGQTMAEYGVILAVITIGILTALLFFSGALVTAFERTGSLIP
jgi:Flp pilus assembly pilin Flp